MRPNVTIRMRADVRAALADEAARNGRSLSEEIEVRLEASLQADRLDKRFDEIMACLVPVGKAA